ncbi:MAG: hypothetical protein IJK42_06710 [Prevotella sp.]|nr:hypothetical protein [Prevotella sp.]
MKRLASIILALCLCIAKNDAQTNQITVPIPPTIQQNDIPSEDSIQSDSVRIIKELERTFIRRTKERLWQLSDILYFLCEDSRNRQSKSYYTNIARSLFADSAQVTIRKDSLNYKKMSVDKFLKHLTERMMVKAVEIDSIMIPKWDYSTIEADTIGVVYVESEMTVVHSPRRFEHVGMKLPIVSAETEDGTEWVPLFGDMIVNIRYKNEKSEKNNRSSLDVISNKLH